MAKKEWLVRSGPIQNLEMRCRLFHKFKEKPNTERRMQNPL